MRLLKEQYAEAFPSVKRLQTTSNNFHHSNDFKQFSKIAPLKLYYCGTSRFVVLKTSFFGSLVINRLQKTKKFHKNIRKVMKKRLSDCSLFARFSSLEKPDVGHVCLASVCIDFIKPHTRKNFVN